MKIHYFKHVPFEGLGSLNSWVKQPGNLVTATKFYEDHKLPFVDICDMLIVMGGPMGVYEEDKYPWMKEEKKFIEKAISKGKKVIGICLGAQLIAEVLGAKVYKNKEKEIGWFPIAYTSEAKQHPLFNGFPEQQTVFHFHGDTFDLPADALSIAQSAGCNNQAFLYKDHVLGLQYHLEANEYSILKMLEHCGEELKEEGRFIQNETEIKNKIGEYSGQNNLLIKNLLEKMIL